ncbi:hypothetical protein JKF63_01683 [Porcisia hertigi]|uniref:Uncharacterized protein n=1 Tax=Porcisia hertigi TaxID=2761500 RepID=A0A836L0B4_9TRYP|nr:hypothetical protein JKF63_01683 [Porcisia hertigi]
MQRWSRRALCCFAHPSAGVAAAGLCRYGARCRHVPHRCSSACAAGRVTFYSMQTAARDVIRCPSMLGAAAAATDAFHSSRLLRIPIMPPVVRLRDVMSSSRLSSTTSCRTKEDVGVSGHGDIMDGVPPGLARELSLLSSDDLFQRIHRFSRSNFVSAQRPLLCAHLMEFSKPQRLATASVKTVQDHLQVAHAADMHEVCIELYHAAREHMPAAALVLRSSGAAPMRVSVTALGPRDVNGHVSTTTATANGTNLATDSAVLVSSFVVDSAYATQHTPELTRIASYCVTQLLAPLHSQAHETLTRDVGPYNAKVLQSLAVRTPREVATELSLVRCFWRALCLAEYYKCAEATDAQPVQGSKEQALADALTILEACRQVASVRRDAALAISATTVTGAPSPYESAPYLRTPPVLSERQSPELLAEALHFVRYASLGDDGEFALYQFCKEEGILWSPQPLSGNARLEVSDASSSLSSATTASGASTLVFHEDEVQVFYAALIDTCVAGQLVPEALLYFTEARRLLRLPPLADDDDIGAETLLLRGAESGGEPPINSPTASAAAETVSRACDAASPAPPVPSPPSPVSSSTNSHLTRSGPFPPQSHSSTVPAGLHNGHIGVMPTTNAFSLTEFLLHRLLSMLQAAKDNHHVVRLARALLSAGAVSQIRPHIWTLFLISAGAVRAADVVLAVYGYALEQLARPAGSDGSSGSGYTTAERCAMEYLLQTSLNALSKCQLSRYEQDYLQPAREAQLLQCTDEFYYSCLLQEAHNSMCPAQRAAEVLARMEEAKVPLTTPIVSRLLKLYLRVEAPEFITVYRHAVDDLRLPPRPVWADQLLLWADRRRYLLSADDREYVVQQLLRSRRVATVADLQPLLGGLRTHFALLYYDHTHAARKQFLSDGSVPEVPPTVTDSRAHFLMTQPISVQRGVMASSGSSWVFTGVCGEEMGDEETEKHGVLPRMLGDASRRTLYASIAELSEMPLLFPALDSTASAGDSERLHDGALRVYLADVLGGLQRSSNRVI